MSALLSGPPFERRDDAAFIREMEALCAFHIENCEPYRRIHSAWVPTGKREDLPFVHVGVFKHVLMQTKYEGVQHERLLRSSATTGNQASQISLDKDSSLLQSRSSSSILKNFLGDSLRTLLVADSALSLRARGQLSARVSAAMSLKPLSSEIVFALDDANLATSLNRSRVVEALSGAEELLFYGFTWILWQVIAEIRKDDQLRELFSRKHVRFVHSGGWKKLEAARIERATFEQVLLSTVAPSSTVLDFYGLVEQNGLIMPLCEEGARHVASWGDVIIRDPATLAPVAPGESGMLQLSNLLARGAPYHSVLTEDVGRALPDDCACGRQGRRFELIGRMPKAELRGCANV
jgi:phenylacetate-coenzyme A ligase PaaK-like adenylate-forming protein